MERMDENKNFQRTEMRQRGSNRLHTAHQKEPLRAGERTRWLKEK
ncbi:hypothetical protein LEMLEM_LOCUS14166, partial [Lemmus lemmus]